MNSWEFMRIRGISLRVHPSWFFVFIYFTSTASFQLNTLADEGITYIDSWVMGLITSILFFISVLLHEFGHCVAALNEGVQVKSITLFFLGGVSKVVKECSTPMGTLRIALAGPLTSIALAIGFVSAGSFLLDSNLIISNICQQIGTLNFLVGIFNLLPVLPLDGGVVLKSLVWRYSGSQIKGIKFAIFSARFVSFLFFSLGLLLMLNGNLIFGLWIIVIGLLGVSSSRAQSQFLRIQKILCEFKVNKVHARDYRVVEDRLSVRAISRSTPISKKTTKEYQWILLCRDGRWVGYLTELILKDIPVQMWDEKKLYEYSIPLTELPSIIENDPLWKAIINLEKSDKGRLLVLSLAGLPIGTVDRVDIGKSVLKEIGLTLPDEFIRSAKKQNAYPLGLSLPSIVDSMLTSGLINNQNSFNPR